MLPTLEQFSKILHKNSEFAAWHAACCEIFPRYDIVTEKRIAAFMSQCGHDSAGFKALEENLNYSAQSLAATWPNRYAEKDASGTVKKPAQPNALALQLHRKPELIANHTYANRMGNGDVTSGDGFRYRGRGLIQLTGKQNYQAFADSIGLDLDVAVSYCSTKNGAIESACWYWSSRNINALADQLPDGPISESNFVPITKAINGGTIGLSDRTLKYNQILSYLKTT